MHSLFWHYRFPFSPHRCNEGKLFVFILLYKNCVGQTHFPLKNDQTSSEKMRTWRNALFHSVLLAELKCESCAEEFWRQWYSYGVSAACRARIPARPRGLWASGKQQQTGEWNDLSQRLPELLFWKEMQKMAHQPWPCLYWWVSEASVTRATPKHPYFIWNFPP